MSVRVGELNAGTVLKLATGELILVDQVRPGEDGLMTLCLVDGRGSTWATAPMSATATIRGRVHSPS